MKRKWLKEASSRLALSHFYLMKRIGFATLASSANRLAFKRRFTQTELLPMKLPYRHSTLIYDQVGQGLPLLLLHGFCEDRTMWADFVPLLSKKYRVLTLDLSGFGDSDLIPESSMEDMAASVYALWQQEQLPPMVLIGHSMGGYVGLELARQHPECLLGLGLLHSHPFEDLPEKRINRQKTIRFVERHGIAPFAGQFVRSLFSPAFVQQHSEVVEALVDYTATQRSDAVVAASYAMLHRKATDEVLRQLPCPALLLLGTEDQTIAAEHRYGQLALPPVASVHILEGIGHMAHLEAPAETLEYIVDFAEFCVRQAVVPKPA